MKLIFGSGKTAQIIKRHDDIIVPHTLCDIEDFKKVGDIISREKGRQNTLTVVNCAAKTNLEFCQEEKERTYETNTKGTINILHACARFSCKFVHISSGCIFDGNKEASTEESIPTPSVWYTYTKMWADQYISNFGYEDYLILRPRQMISPTPHPTNMLTKFSAYETLYVHKEENTITWVEELDRAMDHLIKVGAKGIFNCGCEGFLSPYDIALGVKEYIKPQLEVIEATYEHTLSLQPNRRVNTILSLDKLKDTGFFPAEAKDALAQCLENYGK